MWRNEEIKSGEIIKIIQTLANKNNVTTGQVLKGFTRGNNLQKKKKKIIKSLWLCIYIYKCQKFNGIKWNKILKNERI